MGCTARLAAAPGLHIGNASGKVEDRCLEDLAVRICGKKEQTSQDVSPQTDPRDERRLTPLFNPFFATDSP